MSAKKQKTLKFPFQSPMAFFVRKKKIVRYFLSWGYCWIARLPETSKIGDTLTEGEILHYKGSQFFSRRAILELISIMPDPMEAKP